MRAPIHTILTCIAAVTLFPTIYFVNKKRKKNVFEKLTVFFQSLLQTQKTQSICGVQFEEEFGEGSIQDVIGIISKYVDLESLTDFTKVVDYLTETCEPDVAGDYNSLVVPIVLDCDLTACINPVCRANVLVSSYLYKTPPLGVAFTDLAPFPCQIFSKRCNKCDRTYFKGGYRETNFGKIKYHWDHPKDSRWIVLSSETVIHVSLFSRWISSYKII